MGHQLTPQIEGQFQNDGSLIRSHCSKTVAASSYMEFPFEEKEEERIKVNHMKGRRSKLVEVKHRGIQYWRQREKLRRN